MALLKNKKVKKDKKPLSKKKKIILGGIVLLLIFGMIKCGGSEDKETEKAPANKSEAQASSNKDISDEDYKFYNEVMDKLRKNENLPDEEAIKKIAPDYNMTAEELQAKLDKLFPAAYARSEEERKVRVAKMEDQKKYLEKNRIAVQVLTLDLIQQIESVALRDNSLQWTTSIYRIDPITDTEGYTYPVSFMVSGTFEEKATGALNKFTCIVGFDKKDDLDTATAKPLLYVNFDTGNTYNVLKDGDNIFNQLQESMNK